jgi:hypothetical protein
MKDKKIEHLAIAKELYDNPNFIVNKITKSEWTKFINNQCDFMWYDNTIKGQEAYSLEPNFARQTSAVACYNNIKGYFNLSLIYSEDLGYVGVRFVDTLDKSALLKLANAARQLKCKLIKNYTEVITFDHDNHD